VSWYSRQCTTLPSRTRSTQIRSVSARSPVAVITPPSEYSTTITSGSAVSWTARVSHRSIRNGSALRAGPAIARKAALPSILLPANGHSITTSSARWWPVASPVRYSGRIAFSNTSRASMFSPSDKMSGDS
jgi:hypothetical protein